MSSDSRCVGNAHRGKDSLITDAVVVNSDINSSQTSTKDEIINNTSAKPAKSDSLRCRIFTCFLFYLYAQFDFDPTASVFYFRSDL